MPESITILSSQQCQFLKGLAQRRKVVVTVGSKGLSAALHQELATALQHHELLKLRLPVLAKTASQQIIEQLCSHHQAALVQQLGRVITIYKPSDKPRISLP